MHHNHAGHMRCMKTRLEACTGRVRRMRGLHEGSQGMHLEGVWKQVSKRLSVLQHAGSLCWQKHQKDKNKEAACWTTAMMQSHFDCCNATQRIGCGGQA